MKKLFAVFASILLLVAACAALAVPAFAADSPSGELVYKVDVVSFGTGSQAAGNYVVSGDTIKLSAGKNSQYAFTGWVIEGKYEIVSGSLTSTELVIRPLSDVKIEESYDVQGSQGYGKSNTSDKAPQTGDTVFGLAALLTVGALAVALYSKKRICA